jgi:hypothetical protein
MGKPVIALIFICLFSVNLFAQSDSSIFYLGELKISQKEKGKDVTYVFDNNNFAFLRNDSVIVSPNKYKYSVFIGDINNVRFVKGGINAPTVVICFGLGFLLGFESEGASFGGERSVSSDQRFTGGLAGGIIFGLIGGIVSLIISHDSFCYLNEGSTLEKKIQLIKALKDNRK